MSEQNQLTFTFSGFTLEQVNVLLAGLRELPYKLSSDLVAGITNAAQQQVAAFQEANASVEGSNEVVDVVAKSA